MSKSLTMSIYIYFTYHLSLSLYIYIFKKKNLSIYIYVYHILFISLKHNYTNPSTRLFTFCWFPSMSPFDQVAVTTPATVAEAISTANVIAAQQTENWKDGDIFLGETPSSLGGEHYHFWGKHPHFCAETPSFRKYEKKTTYEVHRHCVINYGIR